MAKRRAPESRREWFPVADGITDHFGWLRGARLQVYLVVLKRTNYAGVWEGATTRELAEEAGLSPKATLRALGELGRLSSSTPRRIYLEVESGRGPGSRHTIRVRNWIRGDNPCDDTGYGRKGNDRSSFVVQSDSGEQTISKRQRLFLEKRNDVPSYRGQSVALLRSKLLKAKGVRSALDTNSETLEITSQESLSQRRLSKGNQAAQSLVSQDTLLRGYRDLQKALKTGRRRRPATPGEEGLDEGEERVEVMEDRE